MSLDQIQVTPLARIQTAGGDVLHAMKQSDIGFAGFGEAYFSWVAQGAVKAWKRHTRMTMNLVVPVGGVRFVFVADDGVAPREELLGEERYVRLTVPPGIWFGFQGLVKPQSLVLNLGNIPHDPLEVERRAPSEMKYNWNP
ncbi:MAG: dTDP-4-dehydrorhamnose 3,5-epimerase [Betaproteobacteria bacterium]|nr:dTDP-4-dehydrorhamnose 3,5-epimerase [Betaproteobacteria bacterium]